MDWILCLSGLRVWIKGALGVYIRLTLLAVFIIFLTLFQRWPCDVTPDDVLREYKRSREIKEGQPLARVGYWSSHVTYKTTPSPSGALWKVFKPEGIISNFSSNITPYRHMNITAKPVNTIPKDQMKQVTIRVRSGKLRPRTKPVLTTTHPLISNNSAKTGIVRYKKAGKQALVPNSHTLKDRNKYVVSQGTTGTRQRQKPTMSTRAKKTPKTSKGAKGGPTVVGMKHAKNKNVTKTIEGKLVVTGVSDKRNSKPKAA